MTSMIEKVARAIADANQEDFEETKNLHMALARAAITAMQDPTDVMIEAGVSVDWDCDGDEHAAAINVWHAMHAAALMSKDADHG